MIFDKRNIKCRIYSHTIPAAGMVWGFTEASLSSLHLRCYFFFTSYVSSKLVASDVSSLVAFFMSYVPSKQVASDVSCLVTFSCHMFHQNWLLQCLLYCCIGSCFQQSTNQTKNAALTWKLIKTVWWNFWSVWSVNFDLWSFLDPWSFQKVIFWSLIFDPSWRADPQWSLICWSAEFTILDQF